MADVRQRLSWVRREMRTEHPEMDEAELDLITRRDFGEHPRGGGHAPPRRKRVAERVR